MDSGTRIVSGGALADGALGGPASVPAPTPMPAELVGLAGEERPAAVAELIRHRDSAGRCHRAR
jgi:hypothetical protein